MHVIDINLGRIAHDIFLFLRANFIDTKPSAKKVEQLAIDYIKYWQKNPNMGLVAWLEINQIWSCKEGKDEDIC